MSVDENLPHPRRDRLKQLRAFCYAARHRSISRAAERIFSSQPAVSQQVLTLEEDLAVTLFERRGPRIALSPAGERLYRLAMPLVLGMDRLPDTFAELHRGVPAGGLDIAAGQTSAASALPGYLKRFQEQHPDIRVNVKTGDGRQRMKWLRTYEVDIVIAAMDAPPPDVEFRPMFVSESMLIIPENHPLAGRERVEVAEAVAYPMVAHPSESYTRSMGELLLRQYGFTYDIVLEISGWHVIKSYVEAGIGIAIVPDLCLDKRDRVWSIPFGEYIPPRTYGVITRCDEHLSLAAGQFLRTVFPSLPDGPAADSPAGSSDESAG